MKISTILAEISAKSRMNHAAKTITKDKKYSSKNCQKVSKKSQKYIVRYTQLFGDFLVSNGFKANFVIKQLWEFLAKNRKKIKIKIKEHLGKNFGAKLWHNHKVLALSQNFAL